jgi:hypothetical protein
VFQERFRHYSPGKKTHIDPNNIMTILVALTNRRNRRKPLRKMGWEPDDDQEEENPNPTTATPEDEDEEEEDLENPTAGTAPQTANNNSDNTRIE